MGCGEMLEPRERSTGVAEYRQLLEAASGVVDHSDEPAQLTPLFSDGSDRRFFRVRQGARTYVLLIAPRARERLMDENDSTFLIGSHLLARGVPAPRIHWADPATGRFVLEDVGDTHFQTVVIRGRANRPVLYRKALALLAHLHRSTPEGFSESFCFDGPVYNPGFVLARELHYFRDAFVHGLLGLDAHRDALEHDFENLAESAGVSERRWVIHRDFQSRNLMVWRGALRVIDFQGMRYGPPSYDLASLVIDPYVGLSEWEEAYLVDLYWDNASRFLDCPRRSFMESYAAVKLCRNLQALAAYAFLSLVKGKRHFLRYIEPAWMRLQMELSGRPGARYPALRACVRQAGSDLPGERLRGLGGKVFGDRKGVT